jgi:DNA-binding Lrp family transcriptional regulator
MATATARTAKLDPFDLRLLQALRTNGRAPFRRIAEVLGSSEQTVARRYRRLREAGVVRVLVLPTPAGPGLQWFVRIGVRPGAAAKLADALAQRTDVSWVSIASGGAEIVCVSQPGSTAQRDALLLDRLPRTNQVTSIVSYAILHSFSHGTDEHWTGFAEPFDDAQRAALGARPRATGEAAGRANGAGARLTPEDLPLIAALREDGRASYAQLAAATGSSSATVARRLEALLTAGALQIEVDLASDLLGFPTLATLWTTVAPAHLDEVGWQVARLPQTGYAAAVSGSANLAVSVVCRDSEELYRYLSDEIGAIPAVRAVELSPVIRRVKQHGSVMDGSRLPVP